MDENNCMHIIKDLAFMGGHKYPRVDSCSIKNITWHAINDWDYCPWCGVKIKENIKMIDLKCKKCGSVDINLWYSEKKDKLRCSCDCCGFIWFDEPLQKED